MSLHNRTALVTGSTRGIGLAVAHALAAEGCCIALNGFGDPDAIEALRSDIAAAHGVEVIHAPADLTKPAEIESMAADVGARLGGPDILVNNAGLQHVDALDRFPVEIWDTIIALNLSAAFHTIRLVLPIMRARGWGRIVNMASAHGLVASPLKGPYIASKHGLVGLTKAAALEAGPHGITCNAIAPGFVDTPMFEVQADGLARVQGVSRDEVARRQIGEKQAIVDLVRDHEIASAVAFLCSERARMITGVTLPVDGGWTAQ